MTRRVTVFEWRRPEGATFRDQWEKRKVGSGLFHQFGVDGEWGDGGAINFSTAIVEMPDGFVRNIQVELIQFD